eukprot:s580_g9.t1
MIQSNAHLVEHSEFSQLNRLDPFLDAPATALDSAIAWNAEIEEEVDLSGLWTPSEVASGVDVRGDESSGYEPESACEEGLAESLTTATEDPLISRAINFDSCVATALMSVPALAPKPIWEEGVWKAIFGNGLLLQPDFCDVELCKPPVAGCLDSWMGQMSECSRSLKRALPKTDGETYLDVVKHVPDQSWEEERESQLQMALKRWLVVVLSFNRHTQVWTQIAAEQDDLAKLTVLSDLFRGRAPATLLKRVRAMEKFCNYFGQGNFPTSEVNIYRFFQVERNNGAPPSRLKSFLEALAFGFHVLGMDELKDSLNSRRLHGCALSSVPATIAQASPLSVQELIKLHAVLHGSMGWDAVFSGSALFVIYSRARWADAMHSATLLLDRDTEGKTWYLEAECAIHKTMHAAVYKHRMLPLVAPSLGVSAEPWVDRWMVVRQAMGVKLPPKHALMPAPSLDGSPSRRPLTATEAGAWLRKLLHGSASQLDDRKLTAHSMKSTMLSFAAKFGLSAETRLQLGYHTSGFKMLHTYSRDAAAQPLLELERMLGAVREGSFLPDCTRSGRFVSCEPGPVQDTLGVPAVQCKPSAIRVEPVEAPNEAGWIDLTKAKHEDSESEVEAPSSSSEESDEEFPKSQSRLFYPPTPPEGYVFWQHRKLRTLHLARPDYCRVFMCNRMIGQHHTKEGMVIRYDTPVCRNCAAAVKA